MTSPSEPNAYDLAQALRRQLADRPHLEQLVAQVAAALSPRRHSIDYASVIWDGISYTFTPAQAAIVAMLWEAIRNGTPEVLGITLMDGMNTARLSTTFRTTEGQHPAWGTMIVPGKAKGTYRLAP